MKNVDKTKTKKPISLKQIARIIAVVLIGIALIIGIFFSSSSFADNYKLGQDFSDKYQAYVGVYNSKADERPNNDNQPNGDAKEGAKILATRLNPLGMKDIRITQAGANYLQVSAPANSYNNIEEFKNTIQRSGSVIMTDSSFSDIQFEDASAAAADAKRTPMSDYFSSAKAITIPNGTQKSPYISYELNGSTFQDLVSKKTQATGQDQQAQEFDMYVFTDLDELFNDVRTYFNFDDAKTEKDRYSNFYNSILRPLRDIYNKQDTDQKVKNMLNDLFYGSWEDKNASNGDTKVLYGSLIEATTDVVGTLPNSADHIQKIFDKGFKYISKTSSYVYSGDTKTEDFAEDGKYNKPTVAIHPVGSTSGETIESDNVNIKDALAVLNANVLPTIFSGDNKNVGKYFQENYVLFAGAVATDAQKNSAAYFDGSNFYTQMESQTKAKTDASIFNAASAGFSFVSSAVSTINSPITHVELIISLMIILILLVALFVLMFILYRLLALFTIILAVTAVAISLLIMSVFGLTIGLETIIGSIILIAMSFETSSMLFGIVRHNFFAKKRGIKTSFKIAVKEAIGFGIDLAMAMIISSVCLFWIGTNTLKSLATLLSVGSALIIVFSILIGSVWMLMLINTNVFDKSKWLFLINIDTNSSFALQEYKIGALRTRWENNKDDKALPETIKRLEEKLAVKKAKQEAYLTAQDEKQLVRVDKKIAKIEAKIETLKTIKQSESAIAKNKKVIDAKKALIEKINEALKVLDPHKDYKAINKLKNKIDLLNREIKKIEKEDEQPLKVKRKLARLDLKLEELHYLRSTEGREIKAEQDEVSDSAYSPVEKRRIKQNERVMKLGSKIMLIIFAIFAAIFAIIMPTVGARLDDSFGGAVVYTVWGDYITQAEGELNVLHDDRASYSSEFNTKVENLIAELGTFGNSDNHYDSDYEKLADMFGDFLVYTLEHNDITNSENFGFADIPNGATFKYTSGINYSNNINGTTDHGMWVSVEARVANVKGSRMIKRVISKLIGDQNETAPVGDQGFTSKRLHPYTNKNMLVQALIVGAVAILILLIYIIVRFKWTYYVALALSTIFSFLMMVASIVVFRISIDLSTITLGSIGFIIAVYLGVYVISSIRSIMSRKNEKSLTKYFEKEINVSVEIKKERRRIRDEIFQKRQVMKMEIKLKKESLSKLEILEMKEELRQFARERHEEVKQFRRKKREEVRRESRRNNYLFEVVSEVFTKLWKKLLILFVAIVAITIALIVGLTGNWSNSFIFIISFIISSASCLFILIPMWVIIERVRIHNKLASKKFVNQIVVSQEEQIVEEIND